MKEARPQAYILYNSIYKTSWRKGKTMGLMVGSGSDSQGTWGNVLGAKLLYVFIMVIVM